MPPERARPLFAGPDRPDADVARRLRRARHIALFLDYDGTLTPIAPTREAALPTRRTCALLRALVATPGIRVAIITGRSLRHVPRSIRAIGMDLAVDHGVHMVRSGGHWVHPGVGALEPVLRKVYAAVRTGLGHLRGIRIERKRWSVEVHYRQVDPRHVPEIRTALKAIMGPYSGVLALTQGKMVLEARPAIPWSKGHAILRLLASPGYRTALPVFIGDDRTDEDGFRALAGKGITIHVGTRRRTVARYRVPNVKRVLEFLEIIFAWTND